MRTVIGPIQMILYARQMLEFWQEVIILVAEVFIYGLKFAPWERGYIHSFGHLAGDVCYLVEYRSR